MIIFSPYHFVNLYFEYCTFNFSCARSPLATVVSHTHTARHRTNSSSFSLATTCSLRFYLFCHDSHTSEFVKFECGIIFTAHITHQLFTLDALVHFDIVFVCISFEDTPLDLARSFAFVDSGELTVEETSEIRVIPCV